MSAGLVNTSRRFLGMLALLLSCLMVPVCNAATTNDAWYVFGSGQNTVPKTLMRWSGSFWNGQPSFGTMSFEPSRPAWVLYLNGDTYAQWLSSEPDGQIFHIEWDNPPRYVKVEHAYPGPIADKKKDDNALTTDPIDTIGGDLVHDETDIVIPCPGLNLEFKRYYTSSSSCTNGPLGPRWTHSYEWHVQETNVVDGFGVTNASLAVFASDGPVYYLPVKSGVTNQWEAYRDNNWKADRNASNEYTVLFPGGNISRFNSNGVLTLLSDVWSNTVTLTYTNSYPSNLLARVEHANGQHLDFQYQSNRLTGVDTPAAGFGMLFSYNGQGELTNGTRQTSSGTSVVSYLYDSSTNYWNHSITQRVNLSGHVFSYKYATNSLGQITSVCTNLVLGSNYYHHTVAPHTQNNYSVVTYFNDSTNRSLTYNYDPFHKKVLSIVGPNSELLETSYSYDTYLLEVTNTIVRDTAHAEYIQTIRQYDTNHNVIADGTGYKAAPGNYWQYTYETNWQQLATTTDPEGWKTGYDYTNARISRARVFYTSTDSWDSVFSYTTNGLLCGVTNANGHWTKSYYDNYGRLSRTENQVGFWAEYSNSILGHLERITLPGDTGARVTVLEPDELGRTRKITYPDSLYETMAYDFSGNLTNHVDVMGRRTTYDYLPTSKLAATKRHLASGQVLTNRVEYDNQFNGLKIFDAKDRPVETYLLDLQDRVTGVTNLEGQTMSVNYGVGQFVNSITRFDGTLVTNTYNSDGLPATVAFPDSTNTYTYYKNGKLRTVTDGAGTISNEFNAAGQLVSVTGVGPTGKVAYTHLPAGNLSNMTSVAGTVTYFSDAAERLSGMQTPAGYFQNVYSTNSGLLAWQGCTNTGISVSYLSDIMDRTTNIVWRNAASNVIASFDYLYNNAGMITQKTAVVGSRITVESYEYDELDRLTRDRCAEGGNVVRDQQYTFDEVGNRLTKTNGGTVVSYAYSNGCNRLTGWAAATSDNFASLRGMDVAGSSSEAIGVNPAFGKLYVTNSGGAGTTPVVSGTDFSATSLLVGNGTQQIVAAIGDAAGNVGYATNQVVLNVITNAAYKYNLAGCVTNIAYTGSNYSENVSLVWDSQYRLTEVKTNGVSVERNGFDANGRRVWSWNPSAGSGQAETNYFVYDGQQIIADVDSTGGLKRSYVWGSGIDHLLAMTVYTGATPKTYFAVSDHLRSVHALADENGVIVEQYQMDAWGRTTVYSGSDVPLSQSLIGNRYVWQGREISWVAGLHYFRARFYDSVTGRWISNDPTGVSGGLNQYCFLRNTPTGFRDPFGRTAVLAGCLANGIKDGLVAGSIAALGGILANACFSENVGWSKAWDITSGGVSGFVGGFTGGFISGATHNVGAMAGAPIGNILTTCIYSWMHGKKPAYDDIVIAATVGGVAGFAETFLKNGIAIGVGEFVSEFWIAGLDAAKQRAERNAQKRMDKYEIDP